MQKYSITIMPKLLDSVLGKMAYDMEKSLGKSQFDAEFVILKGWEKKNILITTVGCEND